MGNEPNNIPIPFFLLVVFILASQLVSSGLATAQEAEITASRIPQTDVDTTFTYQGKLTDGGNPANGSYDFRFTLYDKPSGGPPLGSSVTVENLTVTDGLFTAMLDFGESFDGRALWLEIGVRPGSSTGGYTTLSPRQALSAAPYALSLRPGAVISGTVPMGMGVLNLQSSTDGLRVIAAGSDGVYVDAAGDPSTMIPSAQNYGLEVAGAQHKETDCISVGLMTTASR